MFVLSHDEARRRAAEAVRTAPDGYVVRVQPKTRSLEQNAALWAALTDVSDHVEWYEKRLSPEEWKHVFSSALKRQDVVPGIDGGFVVIGQSTSRMTRREMSDMLDLIHAFGVEHGVVFKDAP